MYGPSAKTLNGTTRPTVEAMLKEKYKPLVFDDGKSVLRRTRVDDKKRSVHDALITVALELLLPINAARLKTDGSLSRGTVDEIKHLMKGLDQSLSPAGF